MKRIILFIAIIAFGIHVSAQIPDAPKSMLSPNAAALGEYGDVPVSHFTGIPQIEIPLYTLQCGPHSLPISLSYHAGGVRPDQHPGWTGLGWSLNAGGCVSRVVKDLPDEYSSNSLHDQRHLFNAGYLYSKGGLDGDEAYWASDSNVSQLLTMPVNGNRYTAVAYDNEPDDFSFNFLDYHGKFFMGHDGVWKVQCNKPVKVIFNDEYIENPFEEVGANMNARFMSEHYPSKLGYSHTIAQFIIIGEDGTKYYFGYDGNTSDSKNAIEYSIPFFQQNSADLIANTWFLSKIEYTDNRTIALEYGSKYFVSQFYVSKYNVFFHSATIGGTPQGISNSSNDFDNSSFNPDDIYSGMLIRPSYLLKISSNSDSVVFEKTVSNEKKYNMSEIMRNKSVPSSNIVDGSIDNTPQSKSNYFGALLNALYGIWGTNGGDPYDYTAIKWYKLKNMNVFCGSDTIKSFTFNYNNDDSQQDLRLSLTSVLESSHGMTGRKHSFEYDSFELLPDYLSRQTDHWDFYNATTSFPPSNISGISEYTTCRAPNPSVATYGTLSKIVYPTGGYTNFEYESHDYSFVTSPVLPFVQGTDLMQAGGLRIKTITSCSDENSVPVTRTYYYRNSISDNNSSGVLSYSPMYWFEYSYTPTVSMFNLNSVSKQVFSTQSLLPCTSNSCGTHVGYSSVIEVLSDGSSSRYKFSNYNEEAGSYLDEKWSFATNENAAVNLLNPVCDLSFTRGLPLSIEHFDSHGMLRRIIEYEYEPDGTIAQNYSRCMKAEFEPYYVQADNIMNSTSGYAEAVLYKKYSYLLREKKVVDCIYENTFQTVESEYNYNSDKQLQRVTKRINDENPEVTSYSYPDSVTYLNLVNAHILSPIVERTDTVTRDGNPYCVFKQKNYYSVTEDRCLPDSVTTISGSGSYADANRAKYKYDGVHNVIEEQRDDNSSTVYLWGYNAQYIVAVIENATLTEVMSALRISDIEALTQMEVSVNPDFENIDELRRFLSNASITTYQYKPLVGVSQVTHPNGLKTLYEYDGLGRLQTIKDNDGNLLEVYNYHYQN